MTPTTKATVAMTTMTTKMRIPVEAAQNVVNKQINKKKQKTKKMDK